MRPDGHQPQAGELHAAAWRGLRVDRTARAESCRAEIIRRLYAEYDCQFKFVVDCPADCEEVTAYLADFAEIDRSRVLLMPMGTKQAELAAKGEWLAPYCLERGLTFCPRRHIEWFGCRRGT